METLGDEWNIRKHLDDIYIDPSYMDGTSLGDDGMVTFKQKESLLYGYFSENLDTTFCNEWGTAIRERAESADDVVIFDMKKVQGVCSMFLGLCVLIHKKKGERFSIENCNDVILQIFRVARLDKIIRVS